MNARYLGDRGSETVRLTIGYSRLRNAKDRPELPLYPERVGMLCEVVEDAEANGDPDANHYPLIVRFEDGETGIARREDVEALGGCAAPWKRAPRPYRGRPKRFLSGWECAA